MNTDSSNGSPPHRVRRAALEATAALAGGLLLAASLLADRAWFERHVLVPYYYVPPRGLPWLLRFGAAGIGLALILVVRPALGRLAARARGPVARGQLGRGALALALAFALALLGALLAGEGILHLVSPSEMRRWHPPIHVKVGQTHPRFGWVSRPSQTRVFKAGDRSFTYAVNARGERARTQDDLADGTRPTLIVGGESIAVGFGLEWDETFAAICGRDLGLAVVNVAEGAYAADQTTLRLSEALARTTNPAVVLTVFVPVELGRILRDDRPRLVLDDGARLQLVPAAAGLLAASVLRDIVVNRVPYAGDAALEASLATTAAALAATAREARERGARPLFLVPIVGPPRPLDAHPEAAVLRRLFVEPGLPFVLVDLDGDLLIPHDGHPSPAGARRLAEAVETALH